MNKSQKCMRKFWSLAEKAVLRGQLQPDTINKIWDRKGKRGHWCSHVHVLKALIRDAEEGRLAGAR